MFRRFGCIRIVAPVLLVLISGCANSDDGNTTIVPSTLSSFSPDPNSELGSRNNPIPLGKTAKVNDWELQIVTVNEDAFEVVSEQDPYATAPLSNEKFVLLEVRAVYQGNDSGDPNTDLRVKIIGSGGNSFSKVCSYTTETFLNNGETFPGATIRGNLCFVVEVNQIQGSTVSIQGDFSTEDRKFFSIQAS